MKNYELANKENSIEPKTFNNSTNLKVAGCQNTLRTIISFLI